jgi:alkylated DNA repair protein (DNA oxidative demethylase)
MNLDLFGEASAPIEAHALCPGAFALAGFATREASAIWQEIQHITTASPWRHLSTPGGQRMSVGMSNCGPWGWVSDQAGYRYQRLAPLTRAPWPPLPPLFHDLAARAAALSGYADFAPDACLINCYAPGARMTLHQDKNEVDYSAPIVSVSLGLPAIFELGGLERSDPVQRIRLHHGDVLVWGGPARLRFHGVQAVPGGTHPLTGARRINLTFRKAS